MIRFVVLLLAVVATLPWAAPARAQATDDFSAREVDIGITRTGVVRAPIRIAELRVESSLPGAREAAADLASRLVRDLIWSGQFSIVAPLPPGVRRPEYVPDDWLRPEAVEGDRTILQLTLAGIRRDEMVWTARVTYAKSREQIVGKRYVIDLDAPSRHVHHLADEIVFSVTASPGIAQTRIIFSRATEQGRELFLIDYDGANLRQITRNGSLNLLPRWSPNADRICYTSYWDGRQRLLVLDGASGESRLVTEFEGLNYGASWAPRGDELLVTLTRDGDPEVYRIDLQGNIRAQLTFEPSIECSPVYDPTGNQIAFTSDRGGVPQIYRMSKDGADKRRISERGVYNDAPTWSPRRNRIAYVTRHHGLFHVMVMDSDGKNPIPLTIDSEGNNEDPSWAPDGRHLVVSSDRDGTQRLWIIDYETAWARPLTKGGVDDNGPDWSAAPPRRSGS